MSRSTKLAFLVVVLLALVPALDGCRAGSIARSWGKPHSANISWKASTSKVSAYRVYRSTEASTEPGFLAVTPPDTTQYVDTAVEGGRTYYYTVKAVGLDGTESVASEKVSATIPKD